MRRPDRAKAGIDIALMDWLAKSLGIPLYRFGD